MVVIVERGRNYVKGVRAHLGNLVASMTLTELPIKPEDAGTELAKIEVILRVGEGIISDGNMGLLRHLRETITQLPNTYNPEDRRAFYSAYQRTVNNVSLQLCYPFRD